MLYLLFWNQNVFILSNTTFWEASRLLLILDKSLRAYVITTKTKVPMGVTNKILTVKLSFFSFFLSCFLSLFLYLFLYFFIYLFIYLFICLFVCLFVCLFGGRGCVQYQNAVQLQVICMKICLRLLFVRLGGLVKRKGTLFSTVYAMGYTIRMNRV